MVAMTNVSQLLDVAILGLIGGAAGLIAKLIITHLWDRIVEWDKIRRALDKDSIYYLQFYQNTVFIGLFWLAILGLIISLLLHLIKF